MGISVIASMDDPRLVDGRCAERGEGFSYKMSVEERFLLRLIDIAKAA
jgi:hypothetical protein